MPLPEDKATLAFRMYCYDMRPRIAIAQELGLDVFELNRYAHEHDWDKMRELAQFIRNDIDGMDPLKEHDRIVNDMLRIITIYKDQMLREDLDSDDAKKLRSKVESLKSLSEAASLMIRAHRDVHGLRPGTPSATDDAEEQGVKYVVAKPPAAQTGTT